jgi:hypothetical protein
MMMGRKKNPNGRWIEGNQRYDDETLKYILRKYREWHGFHQGALVRKG